MINADTKTITHGLCRECGKGGFLADKLCKDCIQKRAEAEHFAPATVDKLEAMPRIIKRWKKLR